MPKAKKLPVVIVSNKGQRQLAGGHLWVFASDVIAQPEDEQCPLVQLRTKSRRFLGIALFNAQSQIRARLLSRKNCEITGEFWRERILASMNRRHRVMPFAEACRLIHGEADGLPGLFVDLYNRSLSLQITSMAMEQQREQIIQILDDIVQPRNIVLRNDVAAREKEGLSTQVEQLKGMPPARETFHSNEAVFTVDLLKGQKTGSFLDQVENQRRAARYARGQALDLFCYEGGFSLAIARQCDSVMACDRSQRAVDHLHRNAEQSHINNVTTHCGDAFEFVDTLVENNFSYDTIILDPPNFVRNRNELSNAHKGYRHLNKRAMQLLRPGGILVSCSCSALIAERDMIDICTRAATDADVDMLLLEARKAGPDHPSLPTMPQTSYLSALYLQRA